MILTEKIMKYNEIFGVGTDYLLKDNAREGAALEPAETAEPPVAGERTVTLEEANAIRKK